MDFLQPDTWAEALAARAEYPGAVPICGGTDVMVELNFDQRRPAASDAASERHSSARSCSNWRWSGPIRDSLLTSVGKRARIAIA